MILDDFGHIHIHINSRLTLPHQDRSIPTGNFNKHQNFNILQPSFYTLKTSTSNLQKTNCLNPQKPVLPCAMQPLTLASVAFGATAPVASASAPRSASARSSRRSGHSTPTSPVGVTFTRDALQDGDLWSCDFFGDHFFG